MVAAVSLESCLGSNMAEVSFFDPKKEAEVKRRRLMAEQLMKQSEQTPNEVVSGIVVKKSPIEGLAKALGSGLAGYQAGQADKMQTEDTINRQKVLAEAIGQYGTDPAAAAQMLMQSPSTSDMGMKLYLDDLQRQRDSQSEAAKLAREDANWEREAELKRELARMRMNNSGGGLTVDPDTGEITQTYSNKPLPVGALKLQQEGIDALAAAKGITETSGLLSQQVDTGLLDVGPVKNLVSEVRNFAGKSTPESIAYANLDTALEKIRNDSLRLNKGVQTEGDAVRAMNEVIKNKNDPKLLKSALDKLQAINDRAAELQKVQINTLRQNYNAAPMDFDGVGSLPSPIQEQYRPQTPTNNRENIIQQLKSRGRDDAYIQQFLQANGL